MPESRLPAPIWRGLPSDPKQAASALLEAWLGGRKATTLRTYQQGIDSFVLFLGSIASLDRIATREAAVSFFLSIKDGGAANKLVLDFRNWLSTQAFSASTISVRMSALKSLAQLGRTLGKISWMIEIKPPKVESYRDTKGPGLDRIIEKVKELRARKEPKACRDAVLIAFMGILGLRRAEVIRLNLEDIEEDRLFIMGKGHQDQEPFTLAPEIVELIKEWMGHRGKAPGPLFPHFAGGKLEGRLSERSVGRVTNSLGLGNAHGLRHSSITQALDDNDGDVRKVARFSRHKNIQTLLKYDDNRRDLGGEVSKGLARKLSEGGKEGKP